MCKMELVDILINKFGFDKEELVDMTVCELKGYPKVVNVFMDFPFMNLQASLFHLRQEIL